jgi:iron complex transport system permease protein
MQMSALARTILISISLTGILLAALLVSLLTGTTVTELKALLTGSAAGVDAQKTWTIILAYRLPRTLLAAIAGAGLASAGVVFQGALKNPLADPYLIGIAAGGSLGAVVSITVFGERWILGTSACAFVGSIAAVGLVYGLSMVRRGRGQVNTVILAGVIH